MEIWGDYRNAWEPRTQFQRRPHVVRPTWFEESHSRQPPPLDIRRQMHRSCLLKRVNTALRDACQVKSSRSKVEETGGERLGDEWSGPEVHSHIAQGRLRRRTTRSQRLRTSNGNCLETQTNGETAPRSGSRSKKATILVISRSVPHTTC
jgi:hypothetical protein